MVEVEPLLLVDRLGLYFVAFRLSGGLLLTSLYFILYTCYLLLTTLLLTTNLPVKFCSGSQDGGEPLPLAYKAKDEPHRTEPILLEADASEQERSTRVLRNHPLVVLGLASVGRLLLILYFVLYTLYFILYTLYFIL